MDMYVSSAPNRPFRAMYDLNNYKVTLFKDHNYRFMLEPVSNNLGLDIVRF